MDAYIGYGFNVNNVSKEEIIKLAKKYDSDMCKDLTDDEIYDEICCNCLEISEYIANIINGEEKIEVVTTFDNYIMFESIRFIDDEPERTNKIRNQNDFISLISKYLNIKNLGIGNVYFGSAWAEYGLHQE